MIADVLCSPVTTSVTFGTGIETELDEEQYVTLPEMLIGIGVGVAVGPGVPVGVGTGVAVGVGVAVGLGIGVGTGVGDGPVIEMCPLF